MTDFETVAKVDDIPDGEGRCFEINNRSVAIFNIDGEFHSIDDLCPHMGASLVAGHFDKSSCTVSCPWHGWRFNVQTGAWADNPRIKTDVFEVRIVGDDLQVSTTHIPNSNSTENAPGSAADTMNKTDPQAKTYQTPATLSSDDVSFTAFQNLIREMYFEKDKERGVDGTFMWLMEEVGELATALRSDDKKNLAEEFADVLAWLTTIANVADVDLAKAISDKYGSGCPGCQQFVCNCSNEGKP